MATPIITHRKVSGKPAGTDATRIYGTNWDDTHVVTGLENVDNTSDVNKPVSTAQAAADAVVAANAANASNLTNGTVPAARLPNPTASTLGGIESIAAVSHNWINAISTSGVPTQTQPAIADLSDASNVATLNAQDVWNIARTIASATAADLDDLKVAAATATITGNTGSPITKIAKVAFYKPTYTDSSAVTITDATNLYIDGPPTAGGSVTFTRQWSIYSATGDVWLKGGHLLVGDLVPSDWPVDAFVVTTNLPASVGAVCINAASVVTGSINDTAMMFTAQGQMQASAHRTNYIAARFSSALMNGGATVDNMFGVHIPPISGGTFNQAIWVEGTGTTGKVGLGISNAQAQLHLSANATQNVAPSPSSMFFVSGVDAGTAGQTIASYGTGALSQLAFQRSRNTAASPQALQADDFIMNLIGVGYNASAYSGAAASISFNASGSTWTNASQPTDIRFSTTVNASTTLAEVMRIHKSGGVVIGGTVSTDPGANTLNVNGAVIDNAAWSTYTPTITSQTGTLTTATGTGRYKQIGKTVHLEVVATVTTVGTGANDLGATLPVTAAAQRYCGSAVENAALGTAGIAQIKTGDTTHAWARNSTGATFIAAGSITVMGLTYEAA